MQIVLIVVVVAVLLVGQSSPSEPVGSAALRLAAAVGMMGVAPLFAAVSSGIVARRLRDGRGSAGRLWIGYQRLRRAHVILWLAASVGVVYWLDWIRLVRFNWHLDGLPLVDDVLVLLPVLGPLVLSWLAFYEVDRVLLDAGQPERRTTRRQYVGLHVQHYLGLLLVPVLGILALEDIVRWAAPDFLDGPYGALAVVPVLLGLLAFFPELLRRLWRTRPLPAGPLRSRLEETARRAGVRVRAIHVWRTQGLVVNAAVAGFVPGLRYVFLTDGLIERLTDEQVEAVFAHELGHLRHHHPMLRVAALVVPLGVGLWAASYWPGGRDFWGDCTLAVLPGTVWAGLLGLAAMAVYVLTLFGAYSRRLESQADLFACQNMAAAEPVSAVVGALEALARVNGRRHARGWQHDSIARRVDFLQKTARCAEVELLYHRRVRLVGYLIVGLAAGVLICLSVFSPALG
ncbi:MAG: M48 family metalloprotease [Pirellulales bacterium]|nr:M48 family metalloprotease [Pirellulales bacterium]